MTEVRLEIGEIVVEGRLLASSATLRARVATLLREAALDAPVPRRSVRIPELVVQVAEPVRAEELGRRIASALKSALDGPRQQWKELPS